MRQISERNPVRKNTNRANSFQADEKRDSCESTKQATKEPNVFLLLVLGSEYVYSGFSVAVMMNGSRVEEEERQQAYFTLPRGR